MCQIPEFSRIQLQKAQIAIREHRESFHHGPFVQPTTANESRSLGFHPEQFRSWEFHPEPRRSMHPAVGLAGVIYSLRSGFDVDVGYRAALNSAAIARQWLIGLTYRWAP